MYDRFVLLRLSNGRSRVLSCLVRDYLKTGEKLPLPGLVDDDIFMLGEGGRDMFLYLGQAKSGQGKVLMSSGLDLLSLTPEAVSLLDGMIAYAQSPAFEPKGSLK